MNRSLRKGLTNLYFQHEHTGHNIGAKLCESEVENELAILRLTLSPVDGNQKQDEMYLHEEFLISASLNDETIIKGFVTHVNQNPIKVTTYKLELFSIGKKLSFEASPDIKTQGNLRTLYLNIKKWLTRLPLECTFFLFVFFGQEKKMNQKGQCRLIYSK